MERDLCYEPGFDRAIIGKCSGLAARRHDHLTSDPPRQGSRDHQGGKVPGSLGQIVLVLQGGGALGAYQVGVYQALHEAGIEPDWVIGTSIGAINAA